MKTKDCLSVFIRKVLFVSNFPIIYDVLLSLFMDIDFTLRKDQTEHKLSAIKCLLADLCWLF